MTGFNIRTLQNPHDSAKLHITSVIGPKLVQDSGKQKILFFLPLRLKFSSLTFSEDYIISFKNQGHYCYNLTKVVCASLWQCWPCSCTYHTELRRNESLYQGHRRTNVPFKSWCFLFFFYTNLVRKIWFSALWTRRIILYIQCITCSWIS